MKIYVTFGQEHAHQVGNALLNKDSVAVIKAKDHLDGRQIATELFGMKFFRTSVVEPDMSYYPRGLIEVG